MSAHEYYSQNREKWQVEVTLKGLTGQVIWKGSVVSVEEIATKVFVEKQGKLVGKGNAVVNPKDEKEPKDLKGDWIVLYD